MHLLWLAMDYGSTISLPPMLLLKWLSWKTDTGWLFLITLWLDIW
jgi:hypothetical protein